MSEVFFLPVDVKAIDEKHALLYRYDKLLEKLITAEMVKDKSVAIKFHLGGHYGYSHVHTAFVTRVVNRVNACGGRPFITDHRRDNRIAGAIPEAFGCPIYHATGLKDKYAYTLKTGSKLLPTVDVAGYIHDADVLINLSHAKGHGMCGYGGAIKNLGMGAVTGKSRGAIHRVQDREFTWHAKKCVHCNRCVKTCEHKALEFNKEGELENSTHFCTLCLHCMTVCPAGAITVGQKGWGNFQKALALAARASIAGFEKGRMLHINVALNITAICDCWGMSLPNIRPDVGVFASTDPIAADQATIDHMDYDSVFPGSLPVGVTLGEGKGHLLERIWGKDPYYQVRVGQELGMGSTKYKLKTTL